MDERKFIDVALDKPEPGDKIEYFNNINEDNIELELQSKEILK